MTDSVAADLLHSLVRRIEALDDEIKALNDDKSDVYKEAKGQGFDVKVLRKLIADRRKDLSERVEFDSIYRLYAEALGMRLPDADEYAETSLLRAHVEIIEEFDPETGEIEPRRAAPSDAQAESATPAPETPAVEPGPAESSTPIQAHVANSRGVAA